MSTPALSDIHTGGYAEARRLARGHDPRARAEVARQFEAYFFQQMLRGMREASPGDPLFDSRAIEFYREMLDQQLSLRLAEGGGIGFATLLERHLPESGAALAEALASRAAPSTAPPAVASQLAVRHRVSPAPGVMPEEPGAVAARAPVGYNGSAEPTEIDSPEDFVRRLRPHAQRAARELGVSAQLLIAQSALETGWGKHVMTRPDGTSSHNLFGIKAGPGWSGAQTTKLTLEFDGNLMQKVEASFRAYDSYQESFEDYVRFVRDNPRYAQALASRSEPDAYIAALQRAGYATDPDYAEKVMRLLEREPIRLADAGASADPSGSRLPAGKRVD